MKNKFLEWFKTITVTTLSEIGDKVALYGTYGGNFFYDNETVSNVFPLETKESICYVYRGRYYYANLIN